MIQRANDSGKFYSSEKVKGDTEKVEFCKGIKLDRELVKFKKIPGQF